MAVGIFDYIFGENRFKRGDSGSDPTDYGLLNQTTQPDYLKEGVDYMAKGLPILYDTAKDVQLLGGISDLGRVAENYQRRWRGQEVIPPTEPEFITNYRNRVENIPRPKYDTEKGGFQGILGGEEGADRFIGENVLGMLELANRPVEMGEMLSNVAVGGIGNLTDTDIDPYYQEIASEMGKEIASDFDSWDAFNKSLMESPDTPFMLLGGTTYGSMKMLQLYKNNPKFRNVIKESFENAKNPGLSIKDIGARNDAPTVPRDELGFYSASQQLINDLPQEVNTPGDVQRYLIKRGVTRGELEETGLLQFFKDKTANGERVTKTELENILENSRLQSKEVYLGGASASDNLLDNPYDDDAPEVYQDNEFPEGVNYNALRYWEVDDGMKDWYGEKHSELNRVAARMGGIANSNHETYIKYAMNDYDPVKYPLKDEPNALIGSIAVPEGDWLDKIVKNIDEGKDLDGLDDDLVYDYQNAIEKREIDRYYEDPIFEWNLEDGAKVVGKDGDFKYISSNGEEFPNIATDLNEVEVFLRQNGIGRNPNDNVGGTVFTNPNWRQPGVNHDYEEILLTGQTSEIYPTKQFDDGPGVDMVLNPSDYTGSHWGGKVKNPYSSIRTTQRFDDNGEPFMFVEEVQSDWHQRGRQRGFLTQERKAQIEKDQEVKLPQIIVERDKAKLKEMALNNEYGQLVYKLDDWKSENKTVITPLDDSSLFNKTADQRRYYLNKYSLKPGQIHEGLFEIRPFVAEGRFEKPGMLVNKDGEVIAYNRILVEQPGHSKYFKNWSIGRESREGFPELSDEYKKAFNLAKKTYKKRQERNRVIDERTRLDQQIKTIKNPTDLVNAPFKGDRWIENTVNRSVQIANERGLGKIAFPNRDMILDIWNKERRLNGEGKVEFYELYDNLYNKKIPSMLKKLENKYGGKFKMEKMQFGDETREVPTFQITPDYRKKVDKTGIPLASTGGLLSIDQMQDDDKMNNKQGLLA